MLVISPFFADFDEFLKKSQQNPCISSQVKPNMDTDFDFEAVSAQLAI